MTISTQITKVTYAANGATTNWGFSFPGGDVNQILVFISDTAGNFFQMPVGQYAVVLNPPVAPNPTSIGGVVIIPAPPLQPGAFITILRLLPEVQDDSISNQSIIYPPVVEQRFDYLTMIDQQLREMTDRSIKVPVPEQGMAPLPPASIRANQQAVFNAQGDLVAGGAVIGTIISPPMVPVVTAPTLAAARTAMGVASIFSPIFLGDPQAPDPPLNDNDQSIATTKWVQDHFSANGIAFPSGTRLLFQQSTPPAGWTKDTSIDNKALRVTSGAAGAGGVLPFTTVFGRIVTDGTTIDANTMPFHSHGLSDPTHTHGYSDPGHTHQLWESATGSVLNGQLPTAGSDVVAIASTSAVIPSGTGASIVANVTGIGIFGNGGSLSHNHGCDMRVQYVDVIIASKD